MVKSTRKSSHRSGEVAKKSPDTRCLTTEVQLKPPKMKRKGEDGDLHASKYVKIYISGHTAEDGENEQRHEIETSSARGESGASRKHHIM